MEPVTLDLSKPNEARAEERLRRDPMIWFGTTRADGRPHLVPVWFLWDAGTILIFSKPDVKIRNLAHNAAVMLALDDTHGGSDVVLIEGTATVRPAAEAGIPPAYAAKYGAQMAHMGMKPEAMAAIYTQAIHVQVSKVHAW